MLYLDNCATTKPLDQVVEAMVLAMTKDFANPSSIHAFGFSLEQELKEIHKFIEDYFGGGGQVVFNSGASESNNTILNSFYQDHPQGTIITSLLEHASLQEPIHALEQKGVTVHRVDIKEDGSLDYDHLEALLKEGADLLCLSHVNSELGTILDLDRVRALCQGKKVHVHIDGVQAVGKIPLNLAGVHSYAFSGHKFHGPKGIGGLYLGEGVKVHPLIYGGGQEGGLRSGTENVPALYGLYAAFKELKNQEKVHYEKVKSLKKTLVNKVQASFSDIEFHGTFENTSPYILSVSIPKTRGEVLVHMLEEEQIYISTASACSSHKKEGKNPIHQAIGLDKDQSMATIRICLDWSLEEEDISFFVDRLKDKVESLRAIIGGM